MADPRGTMKTANMNSESGNKREGVSIESSGLPEMSSYIPNTGLKIAQTAQETLNFVGSVGMENSCSKEPTHSNILPTQNE
jgi:hypothetical protein